MSSRGPVSRDDIDAAVVHERGPGGDLIPTVWIRLLVPPNWLRLVRQSDGSMVLDLHALGVAALVSRARTRDNLHRALNLARCPYEVIGPEGLT